MQRLEPAGTMAEQDNYYVIRVDGRLDIGWADWWKGLLVDPSPDDAPPITILRGTVPDQAALRGILNRLWDLNLSIISVNRVDKQD